jgi:hypothetical protein
MMQLKGIYPVDNNADVHLLEITFDESPSNVDVGQITQEAKGLPRDSWQSPWDEKYLDEKGERVIGDYAEVPKAGAQTRLLFFFHFLDFSKPLITQNGELNLAQPTPLPSRLQGKIEYESPD